MNDLIFLYYLLKFFKSMKGFGNAMYALKDI
jgi:hypothetical protein